LTQVQADKITAKRAELKAAMDADRTAMQSKTEAERKAAMDAKKAELDKWAADNGIDAKYLMPGGGMGGGRGHGGPDAN
jgi:membrane protein involved in colicin uptake